MRASIIGISFCLLFGAGCSQAVWYGKAGMPGAMARAAMQSDTTSKPFNGHIDSNFGLVPDHAAATPSIGGMTLTYAGPEDGKLCFLFDDNEQYFRSHDTVEEAVGYRTEAARTMVMQLKAYKSLDELPDTTLWPKGPPTDVRTARNISSRVEKHVHRSSDGSKWTSEELYTTTEVCAVAPAFTPETTILTAWRFPKGDMGLAAPLLYLWVVDRVAPHEGEAPIAAAPVTTPPAPTASDPGSTKPTGTQDVIEVAKVAGLKTFVKAIAAAGLTDTLKSGGPYTVFAPTDAAFAKLPAGYLDTMLTRKALLADLIRYHVAAGVYSPADLGAGAADRKRIRNLMGKSVDLRASRGELRAGQGVVTTPGLPAKNGVLYVVDTLVKW